MNKNTLHERIGVGAVLYDRREPERRPCCTEGGRCLRHVTDVYESVVDGRKLYDVWCGTHTERERVPVEDWKEAREAKAEKETWGEYIQRCADEPVPMSEEDVIRIVDDRIQDLVVEEAVAR